METCMYVLLLEKNVDVRVMFSVVLFNTHLSPSMRVSSSLVLLPPPKSARSGRVMYPINVTA